MSHISFGTNFVNNNALVQKVGSFASRNVAFKGLQKDEFVKSTDKKPAFNPEQAMDDALALFAKKDYEASIIAFSDVINNSSDPNPRAYHCRGSANRILGKYDEAIADYTSVLDIVGESASSSKLRGKTSYLKAVSGSVTGTESYTLLKNSISDYDTALKAQPDADTFKLKAESYMALGENQDAIQAFDEGLAFAQKQIADMSDADKASKKCAKLKGSIGDMHHLKGVCLTKLAGKSNIENYAAAIEEFSNALELFPNSSNTYRLRGKAYYDLAKTGRLNNAGAVVMYDSAIKDFDKALKIKQAPDLFLKKADAYMALGKWEDAIEAFDGAIAYQRHELKGLKKSGKLTEDKQKELVFSIANSSHIKANCLVNLGRYDEAIADYSTALNYYPESPNTLRARGRAQYLKAINTKDIKQPDRTGALIQAVKDYDKALEWGQSHQVHSMKGDALFALKNFSEAVNSYKSAIDFKLDELLDAGLTSENKTQPRFRKGCIALADLYAKCGNARMNSAGTKYSSAYAEAMEDYSKAIELCPDFDGLYYGRACAARNEDIDVAKQDIRKAIELNPNKAHYWEFLSDITKYSDDPAERDESYQAMVQAMMLRK